MARPAPDYAICALSTGRHWQNMRQCKNCTSPPVQESRHRDANNARTRTRSRDESPPAQCADGVAGKLT